MAKQTLTSRKGGKFDGGDNRMIKRETTDNQTVNGRQNTTQKTEILATWKDHTKNLPTQVQHYKKYNLNTGKNKTNVAMTCNCQ